MIYVNLDDEAPTIILSCPVASELWLTEYGLSLVSLCSIDVVMLTDLTDRLILGIMTYTILCHLKIYLFHYCVIYIQVRQVLIHMLGFASDLMIYDGPNSSGLKSLRGSYFSE